MVRGAANPEIAWMGLDGVDYAASGSAAARNGQGQRLRWCGAEGRCCLAHTPASGLVVQRDRLASGHSHP